MKNLIPSFIQEKFKEGTSQGHFVASVIFVDISGFTAMTEMLMSFGDEGVEILSEILNETFTPVVNAVYENGGFVTTFAGDAFTAVFPHRNSPEFVLFSAQKIQKIFSSKGTKKTKFGTFALAVKVGISYGSVNWGILGNKKNKSYFFRGKAIDSSADCEKFCKKGEIVFDQNFYKNLLGGIDFELMRENEFLFLLKKINFKRRKQKFPRKQKLSRKNVLNFLPKSVIDFSQVGEFRSAVTVFVSFEGAETFEELDKFITLLSEIIFYYKGYFNKIDFGDKGGLALCVFGAPKSYENLIPYALNFALALQSASKKNFPKVKIRLGITYGKVYAGFVGGKKRLEYTVLGDVVNLAARLMKKANWGEVWVSSMVESLDKEDFSFEKLGEFQFKGKSQKEKVFELRSKKEISSHTFRGKFIGREKEVSALENAFSPLKKNAFAGAVYVYGEAGVGKSRFVYEVQKRNTDFTWLHLACDGIQKKPFNPFKNFFLNFFNKKVNLSQEQGRINFEKKFQLLFTGNSEIDSELTRLKTVLAGFLGISYLDSLYEKLDPKLRYENTILAFKVVFQALSLKESLVLEFEDIQWIDSDSEKAIQVLAKDFANFPIIFIFPSRYNDDNSKPKIPLGNLISQEIDLNRFSDSGIRAFSENFLEGKISENLFGVLKDKTEGNPFFIEQSLLFCKEEKIIVKKSGVWEILKEGFRLPLTINDLLISRIDRLTECLKEIVQTASVIGNEFELSLLSEVLEHKDFSQKLQVGEEANIWHALSELNYIFSHILMHEAVYGMQLKVRLRRLHRIVGESLEKLFAGDENYFADLAFHYQKAEVKPKAIEFLEKAGDVARKNFQNSQALEFYENLLSFLENSKTHFVDVQLKKSEILTLVGKRKEAGEIYEKALSISHELNDKTRIGKAKKQLGILALSFGKFDKAKKLFVEALEIFEEQKDEKEKAIIFGSLGLLAFHKSQLEKAKEFYSKQLKICEKLKDEKGISRVFGNLGMVFHLEANFTKAVEAYATQSKIAKKLNDKRGLTRAVSNTGFAFFEQGKFDEALENYQKHLEVSQEIGNRQGIATASKNVGSIFLEKGNFEEAEKNFERAVRVAKELGIIFLEVEFLLCQTELFYKMKKFVEAEKIVKESLLLAKKLARPKFIFKAEINLGKIELANSKGKKGIDKLLDLLKNSGNLNETAILNFEIHKANEAYGLGLAGDFKGQAEKQLNELWEKTQKFELKKMIKNI